MKSEVDQFGRSSTNSDGLSDDKSKRILEALSDIKDQLQSDEFVPKTSNTYTEKTVKEKKILLKIQILKTYKIKLKV